MTEPSPNAAPIESNSLAAVIRESNMIEGIIREPSEEELDVARIQDAVRGGDAHAHERADERGDGEGGAAREQHPDNAGQRCWQRHDDHQRIEPGLKVDDDQKIDQDEGKAEADEELLIYSLSSCFSSSDDKVMPRRRMPFVTGNSCSSSA